MTSTRSARLVRLFLLVLGGLASCAVIVVGALAAVAVAVATAALAGLRRTRSDFDTRRLTRPARRERHETQVALATHPADVAALVPALSGGGYRER